ncbi:MAG: ATP-dependent DNA helicase [Bacteroidetes bacterium HGW-Bacteroidetes-6]|jgi:DNA helicase-2/ATP-dependent DNA helicase PcrA|nr:MAG: ATP-dependent DNA helicase [Bacteroidetes bacterium HGW-Bacteroidetes-6]
MQPTFLSNLNEVQRQAVVNTDGPVMVLAGAGSGKTRVLTFRVAYLIYKGVDPRNILALTFTNKAAREMKERILQLIGDNNAHSVWMGTFHSVFARILKMESEKLGYPHDFSIYDTDDSKSVIKSVVRDFNFDEKIYNTGHILNRISSAKMNLIDPAAYKNDPEIQSQDKLSKKPLIWQVYQEYWNRCKRSAAMDFDDLLYNINLLLHNHPDVLEKYQNRFKYVLVDEYQDTNFAQYLIMKKLAAKSQNICVVGDDAQSIYAFRGANIENILNFGKDYPGSKVFKLEQNYRSTQRIVAAANSVIVNNQSQLHKTVWTENDGGEPISLLKAANETDEALLVANAVFHSKMTYHLKNSDFAILYRTNAQSRALEDALRKMNIAYRVYGGMSFYKRKEVKDLLAYFRLVVNPSDNEAFFRVVNYPVRGIGNTTINKLSVLAAEREQPVWKIVSEIDRIPTGFNSGTIKRLVEFKDIIVHYQEQLNSTDAYELAGKIATGSGIVKALFEDRSPEGVTRYENIESVLNGIRTFQDEYVNENEGRAPSLSDFLQMVSLFTNMDESEEEEVDRLSLMTVHSAKGLEFPYVFITGLEENLFPSSMSMSSRAEIEEERRLFYVAITRAMSKLTLSYADTRYRWGDLSFCTPSRFLEEIDSSLLDIPRKFSQSRGFQQKLPLKDKSGVQQKSYNRLQKKEVQQPTFSHPFRDDEVADVVDLVAGQKVEHARFGEGLICFIEGTGHNKKATVDFKGIGRKQLVLKFARLKILNS